MMKIHHIITPTMVNQHIQNQMIMMDRMKMLQMLPQLLKVAMILGGNHPMKTTVVAMERTIGKKHMMTMETYTITIPMVKLRMTIHGNESNRVYHIICIRCIYEL